MYSREKNWFAVTQGFIRLKEVIPHNENKEIANKQKCKQRDTGIYENEK